MKTDVRDWAFVERVAEPALTGASRLRSYRHIQGCRYRKAKRTCSEPERLGSSPLPTYHARKCALTIAAYALALFVRDTCDGDLTGWIDHQLADADPGFDARNRAVRMGAGLLDPLREISGIGEKVWSMAFGGPSGRGGNDGSPRGHR